MVAGACSKAYYSPEIEAVLKQAGSNRGELVKVLERYSLDPDDSLKLRATEFLIVNMPGKYSEYYDAPWNDVATMRMRWTSSSNKRMVMDTFGIDEPVIEDDVTNITADYLINNIELAFKMWQKRPWCKHVTFETFCEEILPYRISTEPLENWRAKVIAGFADMDTFMNRPTTTAVEACSRINDLLPRFKVEKDFPPMSYSQSMASTRGPCENIAAFTAFVMRALGIPVTCDFVHQWVERSTGHSWNSVCDSTGRHISFMGADTNPYVKHQGTALLKSKAFRHTFAQNRVLRHTNTDNIPAVFLDSNMVDISWEHDDCVDIQTVTTMKPPQDAEYAWLAHFNFAFRDWEIAAYGHIDGDTLRFPKVGRNVLYLPVYYSNRLISSAGAPLFVRSDDSVSIFEQDTITVAVSLSKVIYLSEEWLFRMVGGEFQGANKPDFSDAVTLHVISRRPEYDWNYAQSVSDMTFRYVRYLTPMWGSCNVAEIVLTDPAGRPLTGRPFSPSPPYDNLPDWSFEKAFDGDVATFFDSGDHNCSWVALDLGAPRIVADIRYAPRTKYKAVSTADNFEVQYWTGQDWQRQTIKPDASGSLQLRIPENSPCCLYNKTEKMASQLFVVENGKVRWL
jgi:hypothetical protein